MLSSLSHWVSSQIPDGRGTWVQCCIAAVSCIAVLAIPRIVLCCPSFLFFFPAIMVFADGWVLFLHHEVSDSVFQNRRGISAVAKRKERIKKYQHEDAVQGRGQGRVAEAGKKSLLPVSGSAVFVPSSARSWHLSKLPIKLLTLSFSQGPFLSGSHIFKSSIWRSQYVR